MNIYLLTEEKPKISTILSILQIYKDDFGVNYELTATPLIKPIIRNNFFSFSYKVTNINVDGINEIIVKTVSGGSSFLDYLFFVQENEPIEDDNNNNLIFAVEETKTSDDESRNTGVYQRCSKFIYIKAFFDVPLYMLYNDELELREHKKPSDTSILGTNMLLTNQVKIVGKPVDRWFTQFASIDELINFKNSMRRPPQGNVPILINKYPNKITISGRLDKPRNIGKISHDPNIGALTYIAYTLRQLGWSNEIEIVQHQISPENVRENSRNKFLSISSLLDLKMEGIRMPSNYVLNESYWHYENQSEKIGSILFHIVCEYLGFNEVYQNHAGCERGYFKTTSGELITLPKYCGDDNHNLLIPDIIMRDDTNRIIYLIEGKKLRTLSAGLEEIEDYDDIERLYINRYFPGYSVRRYLSIFGGELATIPHQRVILYVSTSGRIIINDSEATLVSAIQDLDDIQ